MNTVAYEAVFIIDASLPDEQVKATIEKSLRSIAMSSVDDVLRRLGIDLILTVYKRLCPPKSTVFRQNKTAVA